MKNYLKIFIFFSIFTIHLSHLFGQNGWLWGINGKGNATINSLSTDDFGNCFAAGWLERDTIQFGSYVLHNSGVDFDNYLLKLDPNGNILWAKQIISLPLLGVANEGNGSISTDKLGNTYYSASFPDTVILGNDTLINKYPPSVYSYSNYVAKYDPRGNVIWANQAITKQDSSEIGEWAVSSDNQSNCFVTGSFWDSVSIGNNTLTTPAWTVGFTFLAKYDSNGNVKWAMYGVPHS